MVSFLKFIFNRGWIKKIAKRKPFQVSRKSTLYDQMVVARSLSTFLQLLVFQEHKSRHIRLPHWDRFLASLEEITGQRSDNAETVADSLLAVRLVLAELGLVVVMSWRRLTEWQGQPAARSCHIGHLGVTTLTSFSTTDQKVANLIDFFHQR